MKTSRVPVNGQEYTLQIGYQADTALRAELNRMTNEFWGFDFEPFYQSGYWDASCIPYSLFQGEQMVAHTTLSIIDTQCNGQLLKLGQIGTVMCDKAYQRRGLARFLMEKIQADYQAQLDGYFLFANETVLDFYPKFGFVPIAEYQTTIPFSYTGSAATARKLDLDQVEDRLLFEEYVRRSMPTSKLHMDNFGLTFFYCYAYPEFGFKDAIYYLPDLQTIAVAQYAGSTLTVYEIFQQKAGSMSDLLQALGNKALDKVVFGFSPLAIDAVQKPYVEDDLSLFVSQEIAPVFRSAQLMVPLLSHT